jgi:hypothetical protein
MFHEGMEDVFMISKEFRLGSGMINNIYIFLFKNSNLKYKLWF